MFSFLLAAALLLSLLSACRQPPVTGSDPLPSSSVDEPSAQVLADAVFPRSGCGEALETEVLDADAISIYLENAYGLDKGACTNAAIIRGAGMSAFEIAVLRLSGEDAAQDGADRLKDYLHTREADFTGYAPAEADMAANGRIRQEGAWLGLFICPDPEGAEDSFLQALHGVAIPRVLPDEVTDMESLKDAMLYQCRDELTELGGYRVSMFGPTGVLPRQAEDAYGVPAGRLADGFVIHGPEGSLFEVAVLRMADQDAASQYAADDLFSAYVDKAKEPFFTLDGDGVKNVEDPESYTYISRCHRIQNCEFLALLICEAPLHIAQPLQDALTALRHAEQLPAVPRPKMEDLLFRLLYTACPEWRSVERHWSGTDGDRNYLEQFEPDYDISASQYAEFALAEWFPDLPRGETPNYRANIYRLVVLRAENEDGAKALLQPLNDYLAAQVEKYRTEGDAEKEALLQNAQAVQHEEYAFLIVSDHTEETVRDIPAALAEDRTNGWFWRWIVDDVDPATTVSISTPEPVISLNPEGTPTFVESNWREPKGEPDPNHPGRLKYTPPGEEDMSIYDTSAILAAWAAGDPSPLSDYDRKIYDAARAVLDEVLTDGMSDYDKEVAIYAWIVKNVDYAHTSMDVLTETDRDAYGPYGGLVDHGAVCLGYSTTFQLLADLAGLECITVVGAASSSEMEHAWNMVRLDGSWYCLDATWDANARESDLYPTGWVWQYFNVTSDDMARTNHQWDYDSIPEAAATDHGQG